MVVSNQPKSHITTTTTTTTTTTKQALVLITVCVGHLFPAAREASDSDAV